MTPQFTVSHRFPRPSGSDVSARFQPATAAILALGMVLAIFSEGQIPELWTKALLGALIAPTVVTAMWMTGPREVAASARDRAGDPDLR